MKYYDNNKKALNDLISDLENDNGILLIAKEDVESELEYAEKCHDLEKQISCPLEVVGKLRQTSYIYRDDGIGFGFIGINFNDEDKLILYNDDECNIFTSDLRLADYQKTWFLKKDKTI